LKTRSHLLVALTIALGLQPLNLWAALSITNLRCEYLENPLGIDAAQPRLSWVLESEQRAEKQMAYQILVAASSESLAQDRGDVWDSGKVNSDQTAQVEYAGK
jgi:alpha-L-rhamnosidase